MSLAQQVAKQSYCERKKVGALAIKDNSIVDFGYNGSPIGHKTNVCEVEKAEIKIHPVFKDLEISTNGEIFQNGVLKTQFLTDKGYATISHDYKTKSVHRLVAKTFIENPDPIFYTDVNHIDSDKANNRLSNLEWCSHRYNMFHSVSEKTVGSSNYPGVKWRADCNKWEGRLRIKDKYKSKVFDSEIDAYNFVLSYLDPRDLKPIRCHRDYLVTNNDIVVHAEQNIIAKCAREGKSMDGSTIFITYAPCSDCAKMMYQAGVTRVVYLEDNRHKGIEALRELGVVTEKFAMSEEYMVNNLSSFEKKKFQPRRPRLKDES